MTALPLSSRNAHVITIYKLCLFNIGNASTDGQHSLTSIQCNVAFCELILFLCDLIYHSQESRYIKQVAFWMIYCKHLLCLRQRKNWSPFSSRCGKENISSALPFSLKLKRCLVPHATSLLAGDIHWNSFERRSFTFLYASFIQNVITSALIILGTF